MASTICKRGQASWQSTAAGIVLRLAAINLLIFGVGCSTEPAKWTFARGTLELESGDPETGIALMRQAVEQVPSDPRMKLELALALAAQNDPESIALCEEVLKQDSASSALKRVAYHYQANCYQDLGDFDSALRAHKKSIADNLARSSTELNNLAYFRALANRELMMATQDIEKAIDSQAQQGWPIIYRPLSVKAMMACGLISRHFDGQQEAIATLTQSIEEIESDFANIRELISLTVYQQIQDEHPLGQDADSELRVARNQQDVARGILASLYAVRALLHEDLGELDLSNQDRFRIRQLGFEEQPVMDSLPSKYECHTALESAMAYFDTRGFLLSRLPWDETGFLQAARQRDTRFRLGSYPSSLNDFELALQCTRTLKQALKSSLYNLPEFSPEMIESMQESVGRTEAVIVYHRMLAHQRAGEQELVREDEAAIRALGFDPDSNLY